MNATETKTLAEYVYSAIDNNIYLQEIHQAILLEYAQSILKVAQDNKPSFSLEDALRFIDILSNSVGTNLSDYHHLKAQEMAVLLSNINPEDEYLKYVLNKTLAKTGNFTGMGDDLKEYRAETLLDQLAFDYNLEYLQLPNTDSGDVFSPIQKQVFDGFTLSAFSYSAPTSMGKTFVMKTFIKTLVTSGFVGNFAILLPTKVLINEVSSEIIQSLAGELERNNYRVVTSVGSRALDGKHNFIFAVTPERLLYILGRMPELTIDYLFVDEAHKMSSEDGRSTYYYKIISEIKERKAGARVIFASPNIPNPDVYLQSLGSNLDSAIDVESIRTEFSPVNQFQFTVNIGDGVVSVFDIGTKTFINIHNMEAPVNLNSFIDLVGENKLNLVYCKSKADALSFAQEYAAYKTLTTNRDLINLAKEIRETVHEDYYLADLIERGVAYHVGYLPANIRKQLEEYYRDRKINTLFCTSTLLEGVNLPAENLFITSLMKGRSKLTPVDFKNLVGRVGRIKYNLGGNVFVVAMSDNSELEFSNAQKLILEGVPKQSLSVSRGLSKSAKEHIVESLVEGSACITKNTASQTNQQYDFMRKTSMVLLTDILKGSETCTTREFNTMFKEGDLQKIKENYAVVENLIGSDISVTIDQISGLEDAIANGLKYPDFIDANKGAKHPELVFFLERLFDIFNWELYEPSDELGSRRRLTFYAVVLNSWIKGNGIGGLVHGTIKNYRDNNRDVYSNHQLIGPYDGSKNHNNLLIDDTLSTLENVILFSLSNYFLKFSEAYKRYHGIEHIDCDWYEYVEYGTTDSTSITLQRIGYQKESVQHIKKYQGRFINIENGKMKLDKQALLNCGNDLVVSDTKDIQYNFPEFFE